MGVETQRIAELTNVLEATRELVNKALNTVEANPLEEEVETIRVSADKVDTLISNAEAINKDLRFLVMVLEKI